MAVRPCAVTNLYFFPLLTLQVCFVAPDKLSSLLVCVPSQCMMDMLADIVTNAVARRTFSQTSARNSYADTIHNLLIRKDTKVLCQGFTGKTVCLHWHYPGLYDIDQQIAGNIPHQRSVGIWNRNGWRCVTKESWPNASRTTSLWIS